MANAKRRLSAFDCGRGLEGLGIDRGGKLLVVHGRSRRERERRDEEGSGETDGGSPFIGVAQDPTRCCLLAVIWGATRMPVCLQER